MKSDSLQASVTRVASQWGSMHSQRQAQRSLPLKRAMHRAWQAPFHCNRLQSDALACRTLVHQHDRASPEDSYGCKLGRSRIRVMRSGRLTQAIAGSNDEVGRTADPPSKLRTLTEETTMTEDKQCLQRVQRDTTEGRCLEEECGKNMLDVCYRLVSYGVRSPYETRRWLELKPDQENVTRGGTGSITCGRNATPE